MKSLLAFMKKDWKEQLRSAKFFVLLGVFVLLGIMNPAVAKLTPWLMDTLSETLAESGMTVTAVTVTAMDSWVQFFKNIPMGLMVFVILESSIFTKEYRSGTLVLALTKGLERWKVLASKTLVLFVLWTLYYWLCFGITYGINGYFWDNSAACNLGFSVMCWWLAGLLTVMLMVFFSAVAKSNIVVLAGTGGAFLVIYLLSLLPKVGKYSPAELMNSTPLLVGAADTGAYTAAIIISLALCVLCVAVSIPILNKKQI